jgi:hypothetical protein
MRKLLLYLLVIAIIEGCKNSAPDYSGNETISAEDFLKAFHQLDFPVIVTDTSLLNFGDTIVISKAVFTQFIPDSALDKFAVESNSTPDIHPAGLIHKKELDFLLSTFSSNLPVDRHNKKIQLGVFVLDDKHKFLASFPLINNYQHETYNHSVNITEEPTFILKKEKPAPGKASLYSRIGFAFSSATKSFAEVLHDSNEDTAKNNEVINPIDTLASANKYSGDYITDKKNFISVRDGKTATAYTFFIHFEKSNGSCVGELKGMMTMTDEKNAVFSENGDACVINFKFTGNTIKIKEQGNCGNHRGITCPFDFTFKKEKIQPAKKVTHEKK